MGYIFLWNLNSYLPSNDDDTTDLAPTASVAIDWRLPVLNNVSDVEFSVDYRMDVKLMLVTTIPVPLVMAADYDTAWQLRYARDAPREVKMRNRMREGLKTCSDMNETVLDVGMNEGFISLLAASYGCRVIAFEPQPRCARLVHVSAALNDLTPRLDIRTGFVTDDPYGTTHTVSRRRCDGMVFASKEAGRGRVRVPVFSIDDVIAETAGQRALFMHMDINGGEVGALRSARYTLAEGRIRYLAVEYSPSWWYRWSSGSVDEICADLRLILSRYECVDLDDDAIVKDLCLIKRGWYPWRFDKSTDLFCTLLPATNDVR